ncbi:MAG TPA: GNAT family N-acetyltransferase, partial [Terriglobales bacterium]|nr:GNAT family N-acetyltransferase [Terriglobales bacterium]
MSGNIVIRRCVNIEEARMCLDLQKEVWGFTDAELVPLRMFVVADKVGGQVIGAFDGAVMIAFALAIPGNRNGHLYFHSHMLA